MIYVLHVMSKNHFDGGFVFLVCFKTSWWTFSWKS